MQMEIEEAALKKENDRLSMERLEELRKELVELKETFTLEKAKWDNEKAAIKKVQKLREEMEEVNKQIELAQRDYDLNKAAELKYGRLPQLNKQLQIEEEKLNSKESQMVRERVSEEDIARIVSRWTGIPVTKLTESEKNKTLNLPDYLHKGVIGQEEAVLKVSDAILRSKAGIKDPNKPIGSFLFLGPTGVGKRNWPRLWLKVCLTMNRT